jgi:uncharacterized protein
MAEGSKSIGLISDTHGLLRGEAFDALRGCEIIIHAGDIGGAEIIEKLSSLAPVVAVRGNTDNEPWAAELPVTAIAEAGSGLIYVLHDVSRIDIDPVAAGFRMIVSGHSHKPSLTEHAGVLYVNPGGAGPRRFHLPATVARVDTNQTPWEVEFIDLSPKQGPS